MICTGEAIIVLTIMTFRSSMRASLSLRRGMQLEAKLLTLYSVMYVWCRPSYVHISIYSRPLLISNLSFQNAFSSKLGGFGFNHHQMFVVDQLHEFELGVWKATFTHLLRILYAAEGNLIQDLNHRYVINRIYTKLTCSYICLFRYRDVPTFGSGTIRKFSTNVSAMKKLAARDFEDILQVSLCIICRLRCANLFLVRVSCF